MDSTPLFLSTELNTEALCDKWEDLIRHFQSVGQDHRTRRGESEQHQLVNGWHFSYTFKRKLYGSSSCPASVHRFGELERLVVRGPRLSVHYEGESAAV